MQWTFFHFILKDCKLNKLTNLAVRSRILNSAYIIKRNLVLALRLIVFLFSFTRLCFLKKNSLCFPFPFFSQDLSFPSHFSLFLSMKMPPNLSINHYTPVFKILLHELKLFKGIKFYVSSSTIAC